MFVKSSKSAAHLFHTFFISQYKDDTSFRTFFISQYKDVFHFHTPSCKCRFKSFVSFHNFYLPIDVTETVKSCFFTIAVVKCFMK